MPLTTEQKNLRALIFPGKRGKLDKNDQKIFARLCAEKGFPLSADNEPSKPASRKRKRPRYSYKVASSSEEHDEALEEDDEIELEEVTDQEQQEDEEAAGAQMSWLFRQDCQLCNMLHASTYNKTTLNKHLLDYPLSLVKSTHPTVLYGLHTNTVAIMQPRLPFTDWIGSLSQMISVTE